MNSLRISTEELKRIILGLRDLRKEFSQLPKHAKKDNKDFFKNSPTDFSWAEWYSIPLPKMVASLLYLGSLNKALPKSSNEQFVLDTFMQMDIEFVDYGKGIERTEYTFSAITIALIKSIQCMELYGRSVHAMLMECLDDRPELIFELVKLDHSIISNQLLVRHFALAEAKNHKKFFEDLAKALTHRPNRTRGLSDFRYSVVCLHEFGQLEAMSGEEIFQLLAEELKLYSTNSSVNSLQRVIGR
ncbi:MAG: hypothetical protein RLP12_09485, partial [Ekhidna sp.]